MNLSYLTPAATRALEAAQLLASQHGAPEVQPWHLLLALLEEADGRAAVLLSAAGIAPERAQSMWQGDLVPCPAQEVRPSPTLAVLTQQVIDHAREVAADVSAERTIASEHLLLALLRKDDALRARMERGGLRVGDIEAQVAGQVPSLRLDEPLHLSLQAEEIDTARILDASANRAREALRVLEDYCRFSLNDRFLSGHLKHLRHDLAEALATLPPGWLLEGRETLSDVGTSLSTSRERERYSLLAVVQANWKRLQEAFRSLEEFGKLRSPRLGLALEKLRYRTYTLERAILLRASANDRLAHAQLQVLLTGSLCKAGLDWTVAEAAAGGAGIIQLREKNLPDGELLERARNVRKWTTKAGVLFIMNDRADIAKLAEADGVHIGREDLPVKDARRILGPGALIGVSTHSLEQARQAVLDGASYIGVGPCFPSGTKNFSEFPGEALIRQVTDEISLPAFAIGGINFDTIQRAVAAGARRVAVSQAICQAEEPRAMTVQLIAILRSASARPTGR